MRAEDPRALAELYRRFAPLLRRRAAQWRVPGSSCDDLVEEVLGDAALALMRPGAATPRSIAAYLLVALRHRLANARRAAVLRDRRALDAAEPEHALARATPTARAMERVAEGRTAHGAMPHTGKPVLAVVRAGLSTYSLRAAAGEGVDVAPPELHPVLARLAVELDAGLREQDRQLLAWLADHVPMRTAAEWLGIGYDAALKRASRLRARLRVAALAHTDALPPGERRVVHAFLGRAQRGASGDDARGDDAGARPPGETGS